MSILLTLVGALLFSPIQQPMGTFVGELQEKWQFPSDHLPIGMAVDEHYMASWNILDSNYMDWVIQKNTQGLNRSLIAKEHIYLPGIDLTIRDFHVMDLIFNMIEHKTHPKSVIALQEMSAPFALKLHECLPSHMTLLSSEGNGVIVDQNEFEITDVKEVSTIFTADNERSIQVIRLCNKRTGKKIRLINAHLPGDPLGPARFEFAAHVARGVEDDEATLAMGDMNFNEVQMQEAFQGLLFTVHSPYCTNIAPYVFISKCIDHFMIHGDLKTQALKHEDVMTGLSKTAVLLSRN